MFLANQHTVPVIPFFIDFDGTNRNVAKHLVHNGLQEELGLRKSCETFLIHIRRVFFVKK